MQPIFIPDNVIHWFEREIIRFIENPGLWNNELVRFKRLFLMVGQKGTQMDLSIATLVKKHEELFKKKGMKEPIKYLTVNDETDYSRFFEDNYSREEGCKSTILVIDKVHLLLQYHQEKLGLKINHLKKLNFLFIICITSEFPNEQLKFWKQFKDRIPIRLPGLDDYKQLLKYQFTQWSKHWKFSSVKLTEENYTELSKYCAYCTPKDVIYFTECIFRKIIDEYPTNNMDITMDLLENKDNEFLFTPFFNDDSTFCIVNEDKSRTQHRFDPVNAGESSEINNGSRKRLRSTITETGTGTDGGI